MQRYLIQQKTLIIVIIIMIQFYLFIDKSTKSSIMLLKNQAYCLQYETVFVIFFLPCSLFPPVISSFTIIFGSTFTTGSTSSIWRELVLREVLLLQVRNVNLFTQREISTAFYTSVDRNWIRDETFFEEIVVAHYGN